jgi:hypothetical protein
MRWFSRSVYAGGRLGEIWVLAPDRRAEQAWCGATAGSAGLVGERWLPDGTRATVTRIIHVPLFSPYNRATSGESSQAL